MGHEQSVKEWREKAIAAEARAQAYERQVRVMAHMLEQRDAMIRQAEFEQLAAQVEAQEAAMGHTPTDESPDGPPPLTSVGGDKLGDVPQDANQSGDHESTPDLEAEVG